MQPVVILGSGPSLDGFDYSTLTGFRVIAVNDAGIRQYPAAHTLISTDLGWWQRVSDEDLRRFEGARIICTDMPMDKVCRDERIEYYRRERKPGISGAARTLHGMYSGVHAAINLAVHDRAQKIVLLGVDLKPEGTRKYTYGGEITPRTLRQFENMRGAISSTAPFLRALHIDVINGSPDSALTCWPRCRPEECFA